MTFMPYIYTVDSNAARNNNKIDINVGNTLAVRLTGKGGTIGQLSPYQAADRCIPILFVLLWNFFCVIVLAVSNQASKSFH